MPTLPLLPTSLVGSYAQPDWLIDRAKLAGRFPPRVRAKELWRVAPEFLAQAQDDATLLASRRRRTPGSTSSPTARSVARATRTTSRRRSTAWTSTTRAARWTAAGTRTRSRASPGRSRRPRPIEVDDLRFLRARDRPHDQDDRARPVHDVPAGPGRPLRRPGGRGDGVRRGGERRGPRPLRRRGGRRADRRAVHAGTSRRRAGLRAGGAERRARRRHRHHGGAHLLRLRRDHPRAARGVLVPARAGGQPGPSRSPSRPRSPGSTSGCCATSPTRRSSSGCSTCPTRRSRRPRPSPTAPVAPSSCSRPSRSSSPPTAG